MTINNITQDDLDEFNYKPRFGTYQRIATKSAIYPGKGTPLGLMYVALKLNGEAGEFAEHVGKAMRDDFFGQYNHDAGGGDIPLTKERKDLLIKEVGDILWYLSAICNELNIDLFDTAVANLEKLKSRSERNKLQGSGDTR